MLLLTSAGVLTAGVVWYLGRKGWHAFHHSVGIRVGQVTYIDDTHARQPYILPPLSILTIDSQYLQYLPIEILAQLQRIDSKTQAYQSAQQGLDIKINERALSVDTVTEEAFVLQKLIYERLPEVLARHHAIAHQQALLAINTAITNNVSTKKAVPEQQPSNQKNPQNSLLEALNIVQSLLTRIENLLDKLMSQFEQAQLHNLKAMQRYLDSRDEG
ncbi:hypothetical protein [Psychrobacter sp. I-STPA6b]|uniref:hypothetical protein n=1 Tax=Psychrobacter sp. I-STPA6b TaxID=2585718 RepID=UPI001D0C6FB1|nr:hypothetical protein [Psychrobacter sp. I-STPA6b]